MGLIVVIGLLAGCGTSANATLQSVAGTYQFTEGPATDTSGSVYFSDINAGKIYKWSPDGGVSVFDANGNHLRDIPAMENPTNVTFAGKDGQTLFITARTAVYTMPLSATTASTTSLTLTSPDVADGGQLPVEYTCDGASSTLALNWSGAPAGTKSYAVTMHHIDLNPVHIIKPKGTLT